MRKLVFGMIFAASSLALVACASAPDKKPAAADPADSTDDTKPKKTASSNDSTTPPPPVNTTPPPVADAGPAPLPDSGRPPPVPDAGLPPPPPPPGNPICTALSTCCSKLTNPFTQVACYLSANKANELICTGELVAFSCSTAGQVLGPKCAKLKACCESNQYIQNDNQCKDPKSASESLCDSDLYYYQTDGYNDCL